MNRYGFLGGLTAILLLVAPQLAAQEGGAKASTKDTEKKLRAAEAQMKQAEQQMREAERAMREAARQMAEAHVGREMARIDRRVVVFGDRARLGMVLKAEKDAKADALGATIEALTPGGPAEEAGLLAGDVVTKFNGEPLAGGKSEADEDESAPAARLGELARGLKDGDKVTLEYRRGGETHTATVTARRLVGPRVRVFTVPVPRPSRTLELPDVPDLPDMPDIDVDVDIGSPTSLWCDLEMVSLNPDLGVYFGTKDGILVVRAPKDGELKLKAGDVILSIAGRTPTTPAQTLRILRSYEPGENIAIEVVRNRGKVKLSPMVPPRKVGLLFFPSGHPGAAPVAAPAGPAAPVAPAAPAAPFPSRQM